MTQIYDMKVNIQIKKKGLSPADNAARLAKAVRILPIVLARETVNFFKDSFRRQGFIDDSMQRWAKRNPDLRPGGAILVQTGHLRDSIHVSEQGAGYVIVSATMPYAQVHNEGFDGEVSVRSYVRRNNFQNKYQTQQAAAKSGKVKNKKTLLAQGIARVQAHRRHMHIPKRKFMGDSHLLMRRLQAVISYELDRR